MVSVSACWTLSAALTDLNQAAAAWYMLYFGSLAALFPFLNIWYVRKLRFSARKIGETRRN